ncbi:MAG TPA: HEAT repeat domain-containing protein [Pirellulales bacterium]|jgi:hypothetical protein|nr:HEAT repeat domain-containing protein [Pirellulales bacterium]
MPASSTGPLHGTHIEAPYATNWAAVWSGTVIASFLVVFGVARVFWPAAPPPALEQTPSLQDFSAPTMQIHPPALLAASIAQISLSGSESALDFDPRPTLAHRDALQTLAPAKKEDPTAHSTAALPSGHPDRANDKRLSRARQNSRDLVEAVVDRGLAGLDHVQSAEELSRDLQMNSIELDLLSLPGIVKSVPNAAAGKRGSTTVLVLAENSLIPDLASRHPELAGIPFRRGATCRKSPGEAEEIQKIASGLHRFLDRMPLVEESSRGYPALSIETARKLGAPFESELLTILSNDPHIHEFTATSTLVQMLQPHDQTVRLQLIASLDIIKSLEASAALADRAIYDLSSAVRKSACDALKDRPKSEYRRQLLAGLRYPWPPVAIHAARALVAVNDVGALPELNKMLEQPDPSLPFKNDKGVWVKSELVRINHLRNCYLCHAPSLSEHDPIRGLVPTPGEPLPRAQVYYQGASGSFVRADVTYLKQDFSVVHEIRDMGSDPWPKMQRFDYVMRTREATTDEIATAAVPAAAKERADDYPQRQAVMRALEGLWETAADGGVKSSDASRKEPSRLE